jgi:hypothetical protein
LKLRRQITLLSFLLVLLLMIDLNREKITAINLLLQTAITKTTSDLLSYEVVYYSEGKLLLLSNQKISLHFYFYAFSFEQKIQSLYEVKINLLYKKGSKTCLFNI